jgi:hypothetical protein
VPTQLGSFHGKAQEIHRVGWDDSAFLPVHFQTKNLRQVAADAAHDPFAGPLALDQDDQIVSVTREFVAALF